MFNCCMHIRTQVYLYQIDTCIILPPLPIISCTTLQVVDVVSVNCLKAALHVKDTNMEKLKKTLYDISTHVHIGRDGHTCECVLV